MLTVVNRPALFSLLFCRILTHLLFVEKHGGVHILATDTWRRVEARRVTLVHLNRCVWFCSVHKTQKAQNHHSARPATRPLHTQSHRYRHTHAHTHTYIQGSSVLGRVASFNFVFVKGNMKSARERRTDRQIR